MHNIQNGTCTVCNKETTLIETPHTPYENNQNFVVLGTWNYQDATSVDITIIYQTESTSYDFATITEGTDYVSGSMHNDVRRYLTTDGKIGNYTGTSNYVKFGSPTHFQVVPPSPLPQQYQTV